VAAGTIVVEERTALPIPRERMDPARKAGLWMFAKIIGFVVFTLLLVRLMVVAPVIGLWTVLAIAISGLLYGTFLLARRVEAAAKRAYQIGYVFTNLALGTLTVAQLTGHVLLTAPGLGFVFLSVGFTYRGRMLEKRASSAPRST
jgi:predicted lysophospholipase L1 biosynthesis ABC-type transport system permease subunit